MATADPGYGAHSTVGDGPVGASGHTAEELRQESFGELLSGLAADTSLLVKQEIELAKVEVSAKAKQAGKGAGMLAGAGVAGLMALFTLTILLIVILDAFLELWLAALIVLIIWGAIAAVLALTGKKKLQEAAPPVPEQTTQTLKEDVQWAKHPTQSART
jgi:uncharacterized membrane protein YqjE